MPIHWLLAAIHLLALAAGFAAIVNRAAALRSHIDGAAIRRVLRADNAWGLSALILISTGLLRAFAGYEKGTQYYLSSTVFWMKMGLLAAILILELWPMITFVRWRIASARGMVPDTRYALLFARISTMQALLLVVMVFVATAMARGIGY